MSDDTDPTTDAELQEALKDLLLRASKNGVQIAETRWVIRNDDPDTLNWEVEIVPVTNYP